MKWHAHHDWHGWSFGWYPTEDNPRSLTLQHIRWYCFNLDVDLNDRHSWRLHIVTKRNSKVEAHRRYRGLGPTPRISIEKLRQPLMRPSDFGVALVAALVGAALAYALTTVIGTLAR